MSTEALHGRFLRRREVEDLVGLKHSAIYALIREGSFPDPIKLGRASRWSEGEVRGWMHSRVERRGACGGSK